MKEACTKVTIEEDSLESEDREEFGCFQITKPKWQFAQESSSSDLESYSCLHLAPPASVQFPKIKLPKEKKIFLRRIHRSSPGPWLDLTHQGTIGTDQLSQARQVPLALQSPNVLVNSVP